ncbi:hypothetical protein B0H13DRAFT_1668446 [Mycena leptocephala]|nr:hypothetical protein B0H13DRAFT_1668446 [Mycena leptocephala]
MAEVRDRVKTDPHPTPEEEDAQSGVDYKVPTQTLPSVPPPLCKVDHGDENCERCEALARWWVHYEHEVDDLILRSNVHTCKDSIQDRHESEAKKDWRGLKKKKPRTKGYYERRGCLSKTGICKARFPREVFERTTVDKDGHVNMKKKEAYINTVNRVVTYMSRSNTDVTSMLSGTVVKAVISYVSDYVSKLGLKTYQAFASVHDVFERNAENLKHGADGVETARTLMRQMVNSMSTKLEIGSPMAAMYILGNPDHYKSHTFVNFAWRSYVSFVKNAWKVRTGNGEDQDEFDDMMFMKNDNGSYVACSSVDDYRYRPIAYENVTLFEWIQCSEKKARNKKERAEFADEIAITEAWAQKKKSHREPVSHDASDSDSDGSDFDDFIEHDSDSEDGDSQIDFSEDECIHAFLPAHKALYESHSVYCDFRKLKTHIPNFLGGAVPRSDKGDRDYYCTTMLTLFKPWRAPEDLKDNLSTWDQAFVEHEFTDRQDDLIANFNIRYECLRM